MSRCCLGGTSGRQVLLEDEVGGAGQPIHSRYQEEAAAPGVGLTEVGQSGDGECRAGLDQAGRQQEQS